MTARVHWDYIIYICWVEIKRRNAEHHQPASDSWSYPLVIQHSYLTSPLFLAGKTMFHDL